MTFSDIKDSVQIADEPKNIDENSRTEDLEMLLEIISKVNQSLKIDEVLELVIKNALKLTQSDKGCIFLLNQSSDNPEFKIGFSSDNEILSEKLFEHSRTVVNDVFMSGHSAFIENALTDSMYNQRQSILKLELQTILCSPLQNINGKIGVIYVDSKKLHNVKRENIIGTFEIMAGQVTASIMNAKLHSDLQKLSKVYTRDVLLQMRGDKSSAAKFLGITVQKLDALLA